MAKAKVQGERRKGRVRGRIKRAAHGRVRLSVHRSLKHIQAQIIDDVKGQTLASASSLEKPMRESLKSGGNVEASPCVVWLTTSASRSPT